MQIPQAQQFLVPLSTALAFISIAVGPAHANPNCPASCFNGGPGFPPDCATDSARSWSSFMGGHASYDLVSGQVWASADGGGSATVLAVDEFAFHGVAPGALVAIEGLLTFAGFVSGPTSFQASISDGQSSSSTGRVTENASGVLVLPMVKVAGESFRLTYSVDYDAGYSFMGSSVSGTLRFRGLPPGARVVSCQGFQQDFPVPTIPASWGSVKATYR